MGLSSKVRLRKHSHYQFIYQNGRKYTDPSFFLYYVIPSDRQSGQRVGITVSRRIGNAVRRNKVKRLIKEAIRPLLSELTEPLDLVIVARARINSSSFHEITENFQKCARKAKLLKS